MPGRMKRVLDPQGSSPALGLQVPGNGLHRLQRALVEIDLAQFRVGICADRADGCPRANFGSGNAIGRVVA